MSFKGHVENGVVVFDEPATIPEVTVVEVVLREVSQADVPVGPSLWDRLKDVAGKAKLSAARCLVTGCRWPSGCGGRGRVG